MGSVIDTKQIESMPLNGRSNILLLLALAPGVQNAGGNPRISGATTLGSYNETMDGTDAQELENESLGSGVPSLILSGNSRSSTVPARQRMVQGP